MLDEAVERATRLDQLGVAAKAKLVALGVRLHTGEFENWSEEVEGECVESDRSLRNRR